MKETNNCAQVKNEGDLASALQANKKIQTLFYASWCPFCSRFLPVFRKKAETEEMKFLFVQDDEETLGGKYDVHVFPTVLFFENGVVSRRLDGKAGAGLTEEQLSAFVASCSDAVSVPEAE